MKAIACCCVLLACVVAHPLSAQSRTGQPIEFGADASFGRIWEHVGNVGATFTFTQLDVPAPTIRVAFPLNDQLAIEPTVSLTTQHTDASTSTFFTLDGALLYELSPDRTRPQWFLRPFIGMHHESGNGNGLTAGGGVGLKVPMTNRIAARFEARYTYASFPSDGWDQSLGLLAGVSVYTR